MDDIHDAHRLQTPAELQQFTIIPFAPAAKIAFRRPDLSRRPWLRVSQESWRGADGRRFIAARR